MKTLLCEVEKFSCDRMEGKASKMSANAFAAVPENGMEEPGKARKDVGQDTKQGRQ